MLSIFSVLHLECFPLIFSFMCSIYFLKSLFIASARPSAVSGHKMANSDGNDRSALYSFVHVRARGPRRGILAVSYTFYWSFNFENPPGASSLLNILAHAVTFLDCFIGHCYNGTKWPCKLLHNTANFAISQGLDTVFVQKGIL